MSELTVGVRDLKARLSEYLRQVKQGGVIVITEHGVPIGKIIPQSETLEEKMKRLSTSGRYNWAGKKMAVHAPIAENKSQYLISDLISEDRE